jgi:hypothetical protein
MTSYVLSHIKIGSIRALDSTLALINIFVTQILHTFCYFEAAE